MLEIFIHYNYFNLVLSSDGKNIDKVNLFSWASHSLRLFYKILNKFKS